MFPMYPRVNSSGYSSRITENTAVSLLSYDGCDLDLNCEASSVRQQNLSTSSLAQTYSHSNMSTDSYRFRSCMLYWYIESKSVTKLVGGATLTKGVCRSEGHTVTSL